MSKAPSRSMETSPLGERIKDRKLPILLGLSLLFGVVSTYASAWTAVRTLREGLTTYEISRVDSPIRFVFYLFTLAFGLRCLLGKQRIGKTEASALLAVLLCEVACRRFEDASSFMPWLSAILMGGMLWRRVGPSSGTVAALAAIVAVANLATVVLRPGWAFFLGLSQEIIPGIGRLSGLEMHPNALGFFAGLQALLVIGYCRFPGWRVLVGLLIVCMLAAQSKTAIIGFLIAFTAYKMNWKPSYLLILGTAIGSVIYSYIADSIVPEGYATLTGRVSSWTQMISQFPESPLFGSGPGAVERSLSGTSRFHNIDIAHNVVLQMLMEGGLFALVAYLCFLYYLWRISLRSVFGMPVLIMFVIRACSESMMPWGFEWTWCVAALYLVPATVKRWNISPSRKAGRRNSPRWRLTNA